MKNSIYSIIFLSFLGIFACNNNQEAEENTDSLSKIEIRRETFYNTDLDSPNAVILADTIAYDVTIKNPDPGNNWTEEELRRMDEVALANIILNAIYNKRLTAYNFQTDEPMTIEEVKDMESKHSREEIGRMRFIEEWYFDKKTLQFGKKVNRIMLAYEKKNNQGEVRYVSGVMVYLNDTSKNPPAKNIE